MESIVLKAGREKSVLQRHPWIFSGAVERVNGTPGAGETVDVLSSEGQWLARAAYNPVSNIRARVWTFEHQTAVDGELIRRRLQQALQLRKDLVPDGTTNAHAPGARRIGWAAGIYRGSLRRLAGGAVPDRRGGSLEG